ncbi:MAG: rhomboid family intramembrane serine protease [Desulfobacterales bacterium]|jgi:membrane associated rhomboid family serine protease|nr:rhomboid family intramembrane serine protease [Desulfobacterales bacterium]
MIPIRDTIPSKTYPVVNTALIGINVLIFLFQPSQSPGLDRFAYLYGLVPARYTLPQLSDYFTFGQQAISLVSFMFLHGGFFHLLGNMWSLYIFGDNIEDRLGPLRYLMFYLLCGLFSGFAHFMFNPSSNIPIIGASGAIAGVMGAYILLYPGARILTLIPILIFPWFVEIPAVFFLGFWFLMQFINAAGSAGNAGGIAWWAHVGGFVFGMLFIKLFLQVPVSGLGDAFRRAAARKTSDRLQVIRPTAGGEEAANLYGTLRITHYEAMAGTQKLINIPTGHSRRLFRVSIPEGTRNGAILRLKGLGKQLPNGIRGDFYLNIVVETILPSR